MRIAGIQLDIAWEDPKTNYEKVTPWIDAAVGAGARLIVLPEMFACGFSMNTETIAEPEHGPSATFLSEVAESRRVWVCGSVPERRAGAERPANTLILASPQGELTRYRKIHPFSYADEHLHYEPGSEFVTVDVEGLRCSFFVCYDLRFADEFWATAPQTDCYVVVANWPEPRREHWSTLLHARAIENQAYVVGINRVGKGGAKGSLSYTGDSRIFDPLGRPLAAASIEETMLLANVSADEVARVRATFPFLQDRR